MDIYNRPPSVVMARGAIFFENVYGKVMGRVMGVGSEKSSGEITTDISGFVIC